MQAAFRDATQHGNFRSRRCQPYARHSQAALQSSQSNHAGLNLATNDLSAMTVIDPQHVQTARDRYKADLVGESTRYLGQYRLQL